MNFLIMYRKYILQFILLVCLAGYAKIKYDELIYKTIEIDNLKIQLELTNKLIEKSKNDMLDINQQMLDLEKKQADYDKKLRNKFANFNEMSKPAQKELVDKTYIDMLEDIEKISRGEK